MLNVNKYSNIGFKYSVIGLLMIVNLIIYSYLFGYLNFNYKLNLEKATGIITLLLIIGLGIVGFMGSLKSLRGIKEPNTIKKIVGIIINFGIVVFLISLIIIFIYDVYKIFSNLN
ncbi:hypothetical protein [Maribacter aquivivus]|uniref:hypothetical protein n=1 Tax=Maribacter aquivivus TaxID=228958 RepID=UPI00248FE5AD|nr:hypothetical protein [Maribacter aquivivus]